MKKLTNIRRDDARLLLYLETYAAVSLLNVALIAMDTVRVPNVAHQQQHSMTTNLQSKTLIANWVEEVSSHYAVSHQDI